MELSIMKNNIQLIMSNIFEVPIETINIETSSENCKQWDSFRQLNLIMAIEEEFEVSLNDAEVMEMNSFAAIISILEDKNL